MGDVTILTSTTATFTGGASFSGANATFGNYATLDWNQIGTLAGKTITLGAAGNTYGLILVGTNDGLTLDSASTVTGGVYVYGTTGASITNQGSITQTSTATGYLYAPTLVNQGSVTVNAGSAMYFGYYAGETTTNAAGGTITANGTVYVHNISNQGTITAQNGGIVEFTGPSLTTASLGNTQIGTGGGHLYLNGTIDNTSATLTAPTGGSYELYGGTINNGTINSGALTFTGSNGTLNNVVYTGNLNLPGGTAVSFAGGTSFTGSNATVGNNATLDWNQTGTLAGKTITLGSGSSYGAISVGTSDSLTLDSATSVTGGVYLYGTTGATITNQGSITQNSTFTGYLYAPTLVNQGSVTVGAGSNLYFGYYDGESTTNAAGGTITSNGVTYAHNITNLGTITAQNGGIVDFTGTALTTAGLGNSQIGTGGGHLYLNGTINNTSAALTAPTGGSYELYGGTINNGTINSGALTFTSSSGTLNNVVYSGNLNLPGGTAVSFTGGTSFTGAAASLGDYATLTWNQTGTLAGKAITLASSGNSYGTIAVGTNGSLTLDSATAVTGGVNLSGTTGATITNQGSITQTSISSGYIYAPILLNQGSVSVNAGSAFYFGYYNGESTTNGIGGTITANGTVYVHNISNLGTITAQNGGTVEFTGTALTTAGLGNAQIGTGGGHLYLNGTIDNTSAALTAPTGGSYELYAGTINNGTINSGALTFTSAGGALNNVVYTGDLIVPGSATVSLTGGTSFTGSAATVGNGGTIDWNQTGTLAGKTITLGPGSTGYGVITVGANDSLTLDSATSLTGGIYLSGTTGATITNQGGITQSSTSTGFFFAPTLVNQGSVTVNAGTGLYFGYYNGESTTNAAGGTITSDGFAYVHNVSNLGTITAQNGGTVEFTGTALTTAGLGNAQIGTGGGHLYLNGTLDNTSATLSAPTGGIYELYGGTINNGTINSGALTFTNAGGTLSNVSYAGNLNVPISTYVSFTNGSTFTGSAATISNNAYLYWNQNGTLAGKAMTMGSGSAYGVIDVGTNNALTLDSASTLTGDVYVFGNSGSSITNQASITQTYGTGYLYGPSFTNQGSITANTNSALYVGYNNGEANTNASGGTITANGTGANVYLHNLVNQGTLTAQSGGALYFAGSGTTASLGNVQIGTGGGHAYLYGTLDNTAATLNAPAGGLYELYFGTIDNGTIAPGALGFTSSGGTLSNVSYSGDLTLPVSTSVTFTNGSIFTGANAAIGSSSNFYWNQNGTLAGKSFTMGSAGSYGVINVGTNDSLTLDSASSLSGNSYLYGYGGSTITNQGAITQTAGTGYLYAPTFANQGAITVGSGAYLYLGSSSTGYSFTNAPGASITVTGGTANLQSNLTNAGIINIQSGTFITNNNLSNGTTGTIMGGGTLFGSLAITGGFLSPGNGLGTLTFVSSGFSVTSPATLSIDISGTTADELLFQNPTSIVNIGAGLLTPNVTLLSAPAPNTVYNIFLISSGGSGITGYFSGLPTNGSAFESTYGGVPYDFTVTYLANSISFTSVPEPGTFGLIGAGLLLLAVRPLRRRLRRA